MIGVSLLGVSKLSLMYFNSTFILLQSWTLLMFLQFYSMVSITSRRL